MRFSGIFQLPAVPPQPAAPARAAAQAEPAGERPAPAEPAAELPEDLDARVRLVGEWQLGEGY